MINWECLYIIRNELEIVCSFFIMGWQLPILNKNGDLSKVVLFLINSIIISIVGNIWVFGMEPCSSTDSLLANATVDCFSSDANHTSSTFYCEKLLYDFTFYEIIVKWALFGLIIVFLTMMCCCICCVYCCVSKASKESTEMSTQGTKNYS